MNRANSVVGCRNIRPFIRRHRHRCCIDPNMLFNDGPRRHIPFRNRNQCRKHAFSSAVLDGGDQGRLGRNRPNSYHANRHGLRSLGSKSPRKEKQKSRHNNNNNGQMRNRKGKKSGRVSRRDDDDDAASAASVVFSSIHDAQDSMQDLLDRLVALESDASSRKSPITVQYLAWSDDHQQYLDSDLKSDYKSWKERVSIFREAGDFFNALVRSVDDGLLSPSRKHGGDLSQLAECLLYICSQQQPYHQSEGDASLSLEASEVIGAIEDVLKALEVDWNLTVSHRHYDQAIAAACNCREWELASDMFDKQIDPNAGGSPVQLSIENPLGLYAMTQRYKNENKISFKEGRESTYSDQGFDTTQGGSVVVAEQIMDAVQRLVMVSPQDQNAYVLAAGNALGYSGNWSELNDYRKSSPLSEGYGTSLVAAVLRACVLCEEYDTALDILVEENFLSPSLLPMAKTAGSDAASDENDPFSTSTTSGTNNLQEEWQWGGSRDRMDPLIRDLAMQVIGGASSMVSNAGANSNEGELDRKIFDYCDSRLALELFRQCLEEDVTVSQDALLGVIETCERDKDWRGALSVLRTILEVEESSSLSGEKNTPPWIVSSECLTIMERDQVEKASILVDAKKSVLLNLGAILASVMRNCNSSSNFGLSIFALQIFQTKLRRSLDSNERLGDEALLLPPEDRIVDTLRRMNLSFSSQEYEELLVASMVALSGLRCHNNAINLYETIKSEAIDNGMDIDSSTVSFVHQYASMNQKRYGTPLLGNPWLSAHEHIDRLTKAGSLIQKLVQQETNTTSGGSMVLNDRQRQGIEEILASAMKSCTSAHQPELSLYLLRWMEESVFSRQQDVQSFWKQSNRELANVIDSKETHYGDSVTAETILAHMWTKDLPRAIDIFEGVLEKHAQDDLVQWRKTIGAGLTAMVASGRGNDAFEIFKVLNGDAKSPTSYTTIGLHLSKVKDWKELIDLYRKATTEGYSSEELSLLAMLAVVSTRVDNRLRVLRTIVDECSSSVGLDSKQWTMAKYWQLKRRLGFHYARLLMWWNDEDRAPLDEVNLAIKEFYNQKAAQNNTRPKNDVVRAIFNGAKQHDSLGLEEQEGYDVVPRSEEGWAELLGDVLTTVQESPLRYDAKFVDSVVRAYQSLGKGRECLDYVSKVLQVVERTRLRRSTLENVLQIARAEQAPALCHDIEMLLSSRPNNNANYSVSPRNAQNQ